LVELDFHAIVVASTEDEKVNLGPRILWEIPECKSELEQCIPEEVGLHAEMNEGAGGAYAVRSGGMIFGSPVTGQGHTCLASTPSNLEAREYSARRCVAAGRNSSTRRGE